MSDVAESFWDTLVMELCDQLWDSIKSLMCNVCKDIMSSVLRFSVGHVNFLLDAYTSFSFVIQAAVQFFFRP